MQHAISAYTDCARGSDYNITRIYTYLHFTQILINFCDKTAIPPIPTYFSSFFFGFSSWLIHDPLHRVFYKCAFHSIHKNKTNVCARENKGRYVFYVRFFYYTCFPTRYLSNSHSILFATIYCTLITLFIFI